MKSLAAGDPPEDPQVIGGPAFALVLIAIKIAINFLKFIHHPKKLMQISPALAVPLTARNDTLVPEGIASGTESFPPGKT